MTTSTGTLRVATWNVHSYVGVDGRRDVARVAEHVAQMAPDIAAFQEVDAHLRDADGTPQPGTELLTSIGDHRHEAWSIVDGDRHYGQAVISRFPLVDQSLHDISFASREPRMVIETHAETDIGCIRIIATHLGLKRGERMYQLARLRDIILNRPETPTILMGDLNEWGRNAVMRDLMANVFDHAAAPPSYPSRLPLLRLDRIWCRGGLALSGAHAVRSAHRASDHLPVVADIRPTTTRDQRVG
ncbi:endonuclease/exonuclease/phosphatase family protein [Pyruvatibacter sp.]|uniref:endonuclease/exonuclease/phosphatase family protein n=1 Tax=Pyruvatibacter sp. TaxID=1981328 RepID=UPI0032EF1D1E